MNEPRSIMAPIRLRIFAVAFLSLAGCGGGSSSGAGGSNVAPGGYEGNQSFRFLDTGRTFNTAFRFTVANNGSISVPGTPLIVEGRVNGNALAFTITDNFTGRNGEACTQVFRYTGTITNTTASGDVNGFLRCGAGQSPLAGVFQVTRG